MPVRVYAHGERVCRGVYVWTFPILGLYGLFTGTITHRRYFVSRELRKSFRDALYIAKQRNISLPVSLSNGVKIKKVI
jgi:hypothetical protein